MSKPVMLKDAVVTKYSWMNPHVLIYFDLKDNTGKVTQWTLETGSPSAIGVVGWGRNSIKVGDMVTIWLFQTKTGLPVGRLNKISSRMAPCCGTRRLAARTEKGRTMGS